MAGKTSGIDEILQRWRKEIKEKQRRIISFEETVEIKLNSLKAHIFRETEPLAGWEYREFTWTRKRERVFTSDWRPLSVGGHWGRPDCSALFRCRAKMPARFAGKKVVLKLYFGGDGLLTVNGKPHSGLDPFRDTVYLADRARGDETYELDAEAYIFWHFGESEVKTFEASHFAVMDTEMNDCYWDFRAVYNVLVMPGQDPRLVEFLKAGLEKAIWGIDQNAGDAAAFRARALEARQVIRHLIYESPQFRRPGLLHGCGNSHLDVVFLWTHAEFVRKLGRTHASTLRLMEQFPDYIFSQSQPLMYQEMKDTYPDMYEEVKRRVKEGRWEVIGAFWVEPDCNLISGESFTRQILLGTRFIEREFGVTPRTCWCPDVFGNAWTMPQILVKSGLRYFVTHKMVVWNDTNPWKKHTFWWEGPDGSRVLAFVPPTHFIGSVEPDHMAAHWNTFANQKEIGESLYNYGWGDGGGGPDPEMLEYLKRYGDFPGVTGVKANTIEGALDSMAAKADGAELPVVCDELYLEEHRGVHTTKARLKKLNRRCEFLFRNAELWSAFSSRPYPRAELEKGWKEVLNNQFHDSLPGSHITPVYADLLEAYDRAGDIGGTALTHALKDIAARVDTRGKGRPVVVFNGREWARDTVARLDWPEGDWHVTGPDGKEVPSQFIHNHETGKPFLAFAVQAVPSCGWAGYHVLEGRGETAFAPVAASAAFLENALVRVELNGEGEVVSLRDRKTGREFIDPKQHGNVLKLFEDVPGKYEAWDIAPTYTKVEFPLGKATVKVVEQGPVRAAIEVRRKFFHSEMTQRIVLWAHSSRVDFETWVDWKEQQKLLKARFHTPVVTRTATFDIAYGNITRATTRNNSYEEARFEVPAHLWMDLSQPDFGLSLLNDCKYGHEGLGAMMSLSLLRGPRNPDPVSDQEEHRFVYSLYPHEGGWREALTQRAALDLNDPVLCLPEPAHAGALPASHGLLAFDAPVVLEAVKRAEDGDDLVVRFTERHGTSPAVCLKVEGGWKTAAEVNLLEKEPAPLSCANGELRLAVKPYEIRTVLFAKG